MNPVGRASVLLLASFCLALPAGGGINRWTSNGPDASTGRLLISSADPSVLFCTASEGVLQSLDGGSHWSPANRGLTTHFLGPLAADPTSSALYAGAYFLGVFRSLDGKIWDSASSGLDTTSTITQIVVHPFTPSTIYASTLNGVYRSDDRGCHWNRISVGLPDDGPDSLYTTDLIIDPTDASVLYVSTLRNGVYKSVDGGMSWLPHDSGFQRVSLYTEYRFAIDPANSSKIYAAERYRNEITEQIAGHVYRSLDGGSNWTPLTDGLPNTGFLCVEVDPSSPSSVYAGSSRAGVYKSTDAGATWSAINQGLPHVTIDDIAIDPEHHDTVYAYARGRGIYRSDDGGGRWRPMSEGLRQYQEGIAVDPTDAENLYVAGGGIAAGAVHKSVNRGESWTLANSGLPADAPTHCLAIDPDAPSTIYVGLGDFRGVFKSEDGGASWLGTAPFFASDVRTLTIDPANTSKLFAGTTSGLYVTTDGGDNWSHVEPNLDYPYSIVVDAADSATVYTAANGTVFKSIDGGSVWTALDGPSGNTFCLTQHPTDSQTLIAGTLDSGIFRSFDGGVTWSPAETELEGVGFSSIAYDPSDPTVIVASAAQIYPDTIFGVWISRDGGAHWDSFSTGLESRENRSVNAIAFGASGKGLYAATEAGVFDLQRSSVGGPVIDRIPLGSGVSEGGYHLTIEGSGFTDNSVVSIGNRAAGGVRFLSPTRLEAVVPAGEPGASDVLVSNPDSQFALGARLFVYDFLDVPPSAMEHDAVVKLARAGVTTGCGSGRFCASDRLTRLGAAVLLERAMQPEGFSYPRPSGSLGDVDACSPFAKFVEQFLIDRLSAGCGPSLFCPDATVTREQMAAFLARSLRGGDQNVPTNGIVRGIPYDCSVGGSSYFSDVQPTNFFCRHVNYIASQGVTLGCDGVPDFCPGDPVTRGTAAILLSRAFSLP